jgi:hypothetical protein
MRHRRQICFLHGWLPTLGLLMSMALSGRCDPAQQGVPTTAPESRYETLLARSPFALATAPTTAAALPSFAANWFVGGIARIGDTYFVTIKSRDKSKQFTLFGGETDEATGVSLVDVNWSDALGQSTVVVRKGTETAKLEFNEAEVRAAPAATTAAAPLPKPMVAESVAVGLPRGAPELSGIVRNAITPRFAPVMTPPPGNGPARIPWNAGTTVGMRSVPGNVQRQ